jgi:oligoendopeptidase F
MRRYQRFFFYFPSLLLLGAVAVLPTSGNGAKTKGNAKMANEQTPERSTIPPQYKWKTTDLYRSDTEWEKERKSLLASFAGISKCKGKLNQGKSIALDCLKQEFFAQKRLARLGAYANRRYDEDTRVTKYQGFKEVMDKVSTEFLSVTAFLQPELLSLPNQMLQQMVKDPAFAEYNQFLRDILRLKPHILTPSEETLLAAVSLMRDTGHNVYSSLTAADLKFPSIKDEKGKSVQLTQSLFPRYRASANRKVRKATFDAFFGTFASYKNTLASLLSAQVNANIVYAQARRYSSALDAALGADNIPTSVYHNMIKAVNKHLPTLHRYLKLRQKLLGIDQLHYYDMYPSIIKKVELKIPYEQAAKILVEALSPMGKDYVQILTKGLDPQNGWIDLYPNQGKRSGAYMDGSAYEVHPFVLCNFLEEYNSLSTVAHEMGHALHSFLSNRHQPYAKAGYSIFVAEVASTLNEALLMRHMLRTVEDPKKKLFLLGEQLEGFRQTLFRQSMFAEFELALYQAAERKEALTAEGISKKYLEIARRYYGHDQGLVIVDEPYAMEWAFIPHFYYNFYVFQYVTGLTAATALAETITQQGDKARNAFLQHLLKAGGSDYPIALLKRAGVDLTSTKPYEIAMDVFSSAIDQAEALVKQLEK